MVFYAVLTVFQSYHGDSSHYSCLSWVSSVLGWGSEVSCPRTLARKNPEDPVGYESNTLPLSHAGPPRNMKIMEEITPLKKKNPDPPSLSRSERNFTAPIKITWLRLCAVEKEWQKIL